MDREKVIRIIDELIFEAQKETTWKAENALRCLKKELLKEQEERWIPVTKRLPKDDTDILVYCTEGEESRIVAVNYANGVWFDCIFNTVMVVKNITHWMPLPKPPTEGR